MISYRVKQTPLHQTFPALLGFWRLALLVLALAWFGIFAAAQQNAALAQDDAFHSMQEFVEQIHEGKKLFVAEQLDLSEAEAEAFWPVYEDYQDELFLLRARTLKLIRDYAESREAMTDVLAGRLLDEFITLQSLRLQLLQTFLPRFREALPVVKVVRYYQIEHKVHAALMYEAAMKIPLVQKTD